MMVSGGGGGVGRTVLLSLALSISLVAPFALNEDPCAQLNEVGDILSKLERKGVDLSTLPRSGNNHEPALKGYTSPGLMYEWLWLRSLPVMGLDGATVTEALNVLYSADCAFIPWGDAVWKSVRRLKPTRIEGDARCDLQDLDKACVSRLGWNACTFVPANKSSEGIDYLQIGRYEEGAEQGAIIADPIRVYPRDTQWRIPPTRLTFTVDTLAIIDDLNGKILLVDVSGRGFNDACERVLHADTTVAPEEPDDLLRYFELRSFDFRPAEEELKGFIERELRNGSLAIDEVDWREWFCESELMNGVSDTAGEKRELCWMEEPDFKEKKRIQAGKEAMRVDTPYLWRDVISPGLEALQDSFLPTAQMHERKYGETKRQRVTIKEGDSTREELRSNQIGSGAIRKSSTGSRGAEEDRRILPPAGPLLDYDIDDSSPSAAAPLTYLCSLLIALLLLL